MTVREYVGARYVPLFMGDWDSTKTYEPLSIVQYQGNSYTSRQSVPTGIDILNETYWANTGNYNAQVDAYRREVQSFDARITANSDAIADFNEELGTFEETVNANGWVTSDRIANGSIINSKIADGTITNAKLADGTITNAKLADGTITSTKIATGTINSANIADGAIATVDIANSAITNAKIANNTLTSNKINFTLDPDKFDGTDTEKLQAAFDAAANTNATILIARSYTIESNIKITNDSDSSNCPRIHVITIGRNATINMGIYHFYSASTSGDGTTNGGIYWHGISFNGNGTADLFLARQLVRMYFIQCKFNNVRRVIAANQTDANMQDFHFSQCGFYNVQCVVYSAASIWNVTFEQCACEHSARFLDTDVTRAGAATRNLIIRDTVIEGCTTIPIRLFGSLFNVLISGCYFELNASATADVPSRHDFQIGGSPQVLTIESCYFVGYENGSALHITDPVGGGNDGQIVAKNCKVEHGYMFGCPANRIAVCNIDNCVTELGYFSSDSNENHINTSPRTPIYKAENLGTFTPTANTWSYTEKSFTVDQYSDFIVKVEAEFMNAAPLGVAISRTNQVSGICAVNEVSASTGGSLSVMFSEHVEATTTFYIFVKYPSTAQESCNYQLREYRRFA